MMMLLIGAFSLADLEFVSDHVIANTADGPVQGDVFTLHTGNKVNAFLGIPFAEAPVGEMRWQPPVQQQPWTEVFIANTLGTACVQTESVLWTTHPLWNNYGENCLNLNVYAPNYTAGALYPVMVWFHGGSYQSGANIQYPGYFLADKGTVVVVPNYRLNVIGFATTADAAAPGNYGMLDQVLALQWVQRNIAAYGGDANQVTIFGESAGAHGNGLHLLSNLSKGLFHQAILMSGSEFATGSMNPPQSHPEDYTKSVAQQNGCPTTDNWTMMECLRTINAKALQQTPIDCKPGYQCLGMAPVVDNSFLTDTPLNLRQAGNVTRVPELIGWTSQESSLFAATYYPSFNVIGPNRKEFEDIVREAAQFYMPLVPDPLLEEDLVEALTWFYSPWPHLDDRDLNRYQICMMLTDVDFGFSADYQIKLHTRLPATTYEYIFAYVSKESASPEWMGAYHTVDIPYVWGLFLLDMNPDVKNHSGIADGGNYDADDIAYSEFFMTVLTNFAKTGNPTPTPVATPNGDPDTLWLPFTTENLYYMYIGNDDVGQREDYRQQEYAFWHSYLTTVMLDSDWPFPSVYQLSY